MTIFSPMPPDNSSDMSATARRRRRAILPVEREFAQLLDQLNVELAPRMKRPIAQRHRLAEDVMSSFVGGMGKQLTELLAGTPIPVALDKLEVIVSLFYGTIFDMYFGVDSHLPSRFREVHPFLLETLADSRLRDMNDSPNRNLNDTHPECYAPQWIRIMPHSIKALEDDFAEHPDAAREYFGQHIRHNITLLHVEPRRHEQIRRDILSGEWTSDIGLWVHKCALLFEPSIDRASKRLQLELVYPSDDRFEKYCQYVKRLIEHAEVVELRGDSIQCRPLAPHSKEHILWNLEEMFEPDLADAWEEFVSRRRRIKSLGPFIERYIERIGVDTANILDAATGTGAESIYLASKGHSVVSNEIEPRLIAHAQEAAEAAGVSLNLTQYDWRHLEHLASPEHFDVILALGNSLSCLPSSAAVRTVLTRFAHLLRPNGIIIIDERNYPAIFNNRRNMEKGDFRFGAGVVYCSTSIRARPHYIPDSPGNHNDLLILEYLRQNGTSVGKFKVLPFADGVLKKLLEETGFHKIDAFYNLREPNGNRATAEFITYVASRSYTPSALVEHTELDAVVAFSDISRSTSLKKEIGEERYAREWDKHDKRARKLIRKYKGEVIASTGDGYLIRFATSTSAVACMSALVANSGSDSLVVRAGISKGKVFSDKHGNIRGDEVNVAARICDEAKPDKLFVDDRVKIEVTDCEWEQADIVELRGVGERQLWRLCD